MQSLWKRTGTRFDRTKEKWNGNRKSGRRKITRTLQVSWISMWNRKTVDFTKNAITNGCFSRFVFSADDWICGRCSNVNWQRRKNCNVCSAPKVSEVEERTGESNKVWSSTNRMKCNFKNWNFDGFSGYGGGYNDRGVVEYKERKEDSDDEFDDFGRRKKKRDEKRSFHREDSSSNSRNDSGHRSAKWNKKKKMKISTSTSIFMDRFLFYFQNFSKRPKKDETKDNEEDDDEDSDEDDSNSGDISKYQLFDSESDTEQKLPAQKKGAESPRSRRSRSK